MIFIDYNTKSNTLKIEWSLVRALKFFFIALAFGVATEFVFGVSGLAHGFITIFGDGGGL